MLPEYYLHKYFKLFLLPQQWSTHNSNNLYALDLRIFDSMCSEIWENHFSPEGKHSDQKICPSMETPCSEPANFWTLPIAGHIREGLEPLCCWPSRSTGWQLCEAGCRTRRTTDLIQKGAPYAEWTTQLLVPPRPACTELCTLCKSLYLHNEHESWNCATLMQNCDPPTHFL